MIQNAHVCARWVSAACTLSVSRRHARLILEGGNYFVEDLDSTNFTFVNKQKLVPKTRQAVGDGDEIRCGRVALILKMS